MRRAELLFNEYDLRAVLEAHRKKGETAVGSLSVADVSEPVEDTVLDRLEAEYRVAPLEVLADEVTVEQEEAQVDVSRDPGRYIRDPSRPFYIPGHRIRYFVPYRGDQHLWRCQPSQFTMNPPAAELGDDELIFDFLVPGAEIAQTKAWYETELAKVRQWVGFARADIDAHNEQVRPVLKEALRRRRELLGKASEQVQALGLPRRQKAPPAPVPPTPSSPRRPRSTPSRGALNVAAEYDVALSFAGEDRDYVERVATLLREAGIKVFYDRFETAQLWGRNLADHLGEIYGKRSRFVVLFVSRHYPAKAWPTHERQNAHARAIREKKIVLLPARFDETEIPGLPSTTAYVDLRSTTPEDLVALIKEKLKEDA